MTVRPGKGRTNEQIENHERVWNPAVSNQNGSSREGTGFP